jgi:hypothetical protein
MEMLHKALADLPVEEARKHMKACADSGTGLPPHYTQRKDDPLDASLH